MSVPWKFCRCLAGAPGLSGLSGSELLPKQVCRAVVCLRRGIDVEIVADDPGKRVIDTRIGMHRDVCIAAKCGRDLFLGSGGQNPSSSATCRVSVFLMVAAISSESSIWTG